ncbi:MAG TPA: rhodanese-like domain-containing protein [Hyphomicrobiaceae bacterium]|jgi:PQQ-dependent catabolism-associated CXXCW motif protein|nr:rhodanese-like domain-containing protein [Hyphomicrobiaceae bacterium]
MRTAIEAAAKAAIGLAALLFPAVASAGPGDVQEPPGLWTGPMYGQTPRTLAGAVVVDLAALEALAGVKPLLLDVGPAARKPETFPASRPWLPTHRSIPGAVWMPGAGAAPLDTEHEALFFRRIAELTHGDVIRPIVVFCQPNCWGSWNAGKRLVMKGYTGVHWFPAGVDGWQDKHQTAEVKPDMGWSASLVENGSRQ